MISDYVLSRERYADTLPELEPIYRAHYGEMKSRLAADGMPIGDFAPRYDKYSEACDNGWLFHFVLRLSGVAVGYGNVYVSHDMHNGELIAREDAIYVVPEHRKGVGKAATQQVMAYLRGMGVKRLHVTAMTDLRVAKLWERMGFRHTAHAMTYFF